MLFVVLGAGVVGTSKTDVNPRSHSAYSLAERTLILFLYCMVGHQRPLGYYILSQTFLCCCSITKFVRLFATPWTAARQASLSFTFSWSLLKLMSIESMMPSNHLILCRPLLLLPSVFPRIRVFSIESAVCIRWPKYWNFSFSPSNEYSGLISFKIDWLDLLAVQGTLKKASYVITPYVIPKRMSQTFFYINQILYLKKYIRTTKVTDLSLKKSHPRG